MVENFTYDQVNRYLALFDDLGFFYKRGALDEGTIRQLFGSVLHRSVQIPRAKEIRC